MQCFVRHNCEFLRVSDNWPMGADPETPPLAGVDDRAVYPRSGES